jgi:aminopeptidase N
MNRFVLLFAFALLPVILTAQVLPEMKHAHFHGCEGITALDGKTALASDKLADFDVKYYKIDLEVNDTSTYISGNTIVKTEIVGEAIDTFVLELNTGLTVDSVYINGIRHNFNHRDDLLLIRLINSYEKGASVTARVFYQGMAGESSNTGIFNQSHNQSDFRVTYTLSEPFASKSWFPVKQDLTDKADSVEVFITVPEHLKAGSNGILQAVTSQNNGKTRYEWKSRYPIAYYLISIAVADYQEYNIWARPEGFTDSLLVQNFIYDIPGLLESYKEDIDETVDMIHLFSELYSPYPFYEEKYGHAMAPFGGGMEHQTMTTILNFQFFLVAHELAHQWFGNNVTCATWQDIWINEGFASYSEYIAIQKLSSQEVADRWMQSALDRVTSQPGGSVYVPVEEVDSERRIFDYRLSYKKGAIILHMLRFEINSDELFFETLREFQMRYKDSVATGNDFKNVAEDVTGEDWDYFFDQWYYGEGYPEYTINWEQIGDSLFISSDQRSSTDYPQFFKTSLEFNITYTNNNSEMIRVKQEKPSELFGIKVNGDVLELEFDPNLWMLKRISSDSFIERKPVTDDIRIVPNPAKNNVKIEFAPPVNNRTVQVFSTAGKIVYSSNLNTTSLIIDTSGWSEGIYVLKAGDNTKLLHGKIVIEK